VLHIEILTLQDRMNTVSICGAGKDFSRWTVRQIDHLLKEIAVLHDQLIRVTGEAWDYLLSLP
jgi:hypothetical protein